MRRAGRARGRRARGDRAARSPRARAATSVRPTPTARAPPCSPRSRAWPARRRRAAGLTVVGVTGSSGKTSTKDLLGRCSRRRARRSPARVVQQRHRPALTVLRADAGTRYLVLEMLRARPGPHRRAVRGRAAAGRRGAQRRLRPPRRVRLAARHRARPRASWSRRCRRTAPPCSTPTTRASPRMAPRTRARVLTTGRGAGADVRAADVTLDDAARARFTPGHAAGRRAGGAAGASASTRSPTRCPRPRSRSSWAATPGDVAAALLGRRARAPLAHGGDRRADGVTVVNDAYNANPESMRAALRALAAVRAASGGIAVLGAMAELGAERAPPSTSGSAAPRPPASTCSWPWDRCVGIADGAAAAGRTARSRCRCRTAHAALALLPAVLRARGRRPGEGQPLLRAELLAADLLARGRRVRSVLIAAGFALIDLDPAHPVPHPRLPPAGPRAGDPGRRPGEPPVQAGHAHDGRRRDRRRDRRRLPRSRTCRRPASRSRAAALLLLFLMVGAGRRRLPRRLPQDPAPPQPRPEQDRQARRPAGRRRRLRRSWRSTSPNADGLTPASTRLLRPRHRPARVRRWSAS